MGGEEVKHLSLFTGIGGIDLAAEWAGFESVCMVERDKYCQKVLAKNFEGVKIHDDVTTFNGLEYRGAIDLVSAGFPCQPHSLAGLRKASGDERDLWGEVVRILRETQSTWFLGENVPGLFTSESGQFFGRIINDLESLGYSVGWGCYGAKDVGAVHKRDRVFIVAYASGLRLNSSRQENQELKDNSAREWQNGQGKPEWSEVDSGLVDHGASQTDVTNAKGKRCQEQWEPKQLETQQLAIEHNSFIGNSNCKPRLQSSSTAISIRSERDSREDVGGRCWQPIRGGDWREWGIRAAIPQSRICRDDDGIPYRVDKHRTQRLKALGNAVVPQQVFPILQEIARQIRENGGATP
jgi:DNA (cytosine-5)-methyltransferase 1